MDYKKQFLTIKNEQDNTDACYNILHGSSKIMISAPHCTKHFRNGKVLFAEPETKFLAKLLHNNLSCPIIYKTANLNDDANYDKHCVYKQALQEYVLQNDIKFVIDLHQMSSKRKEIINLGTNNLNNLSLKNLNVFIKNFSKQKLGIISVDSPFGAKYPFTVSTYIHNKCNIQTVQVEINCNVFDSNINEICASLTQIVKDLKVLLGEPIC